MIIVCCKLRAVKKSMLVVFAAGARKVKCFLVEKRRLDLTIPGKQSN